MYNLSKTLKSLLERNKLSPAQLARASGVSEPKISRWLNGSQSYISDDDLESVAMNITEKPKERAELVAARLKDNLSGPGSEFVEIVIAGQELRENPTGYKNTLPPELEEALPYFVKFWKDTDVRNMILGLANLLRNGDCRIE